MKYRVHKIEHNYNQIWHGIKAKKKHSCKLQLYNTEMQGGSLLLFPKKPNFFLQFL